MKKTMTFLLVSVALLMTGCRTAKNIVREVHTTSVRDTLWQTRWRERVDSVFIHDTCYIDTAGVFHHDRRESRTARVLTGDTVVKTVEVAVHDSVPYPVEVVKEVHRRSRYDKFCSRFFWFVVVILLLTTVFKVLDRIPATKPYTTMIKGFFKISKWFKQ